MIYQPAEDSVLLAKAVSKLARGKVLDMGTGSGFLAEAAIELPVVDSVLGVDINPEAVAHCRKRIKHKSVSFRESDLFSNVRGIFDTIIFNPPYLPQDKGFHDVALHGGKHGHETICRFLEEAGDHLSENGRILLLFSSHSKTDKVEGCLGSNLYAYKSLSARHIFFEDLYVYEVRKERIRRDIERKGVGGLRYLDRGKRGMVYTGKLNGMKVAVKIERADSKAPERLANEAKWLDHLRSTGICADLLFRGKNWICYRFVEGEFLPEYLTSGSASGVYTALMKTLDHCRVLDELGVNKQEMTRPIKHVLVREQVNRWSLRNRRSVEVRFLDFERARFAKKPSNVTQFVQWLNRDETKRRLRGKVRVSSKILDAAKSYKRAMDRESFDEVKRCLTRK